MLPKTLRLFANLDEFGKFGRVGDGEIFFISNELRFKLRIKRSFNLDVTEFNLFECEGGGAGEKLILFAGRWVQVFGLGLRVY